MKILVTGASGFVGSAVVNELVSRAGFSLRAAVRHGNQRLSSAVDVVQVGDLAAGTDWKSALRDVSIVVHAAARVHVMQDAAINPLAEFRRVNVEGTLSLARQAAEAGVKRFIFISSVKVCGEETSLGVPCRADDYPMPVDPYAVSKLEAEQGLQQLARKTGMEVVIIRPPLVYGPGVKGNFASIMNLVMKGVPLPLGEVNNKRSFVGLDNLIDFIITCIDHPAAANNTFLVADGEDLSTTQLLQRLANLMGKKPLLIAVPTKIIESFAGLFGKKAIAQRLCGNLQIDISKAREVLDWEPPVSVDEGLNRCVVNSPDKKHTGKIYAIRFFDIAFSLFGLIAGFPLFILIIVFGLFDTGSPLFLQQRVGRKQKPFTLLKFRTMKLDTASVATHLSSASSITKFGRFLRKTKLDEVPQLWNVLKGEMSLVGPRPCLFNQEELIQERAKRGVFDVRPGITGLAQVNGIDMSRPSLLAKMDAKMINKLTLRSYFSYIVQTVMGKGAGDRVINP